MQSTTKSKLTTVDLVQCGLFVSLIVAGAYIKIMIPLGPFSVTFSLQFLFSLMAGLLMGGKKGADVLVVKDLHQVPVIQPGPADSPFRDVKAQGTHQVELAAGGGAGAGDVAGVPQSAGRSMKGFRIRRSKNHSWPLSSGNCHTTFAVWFTITFSSTM